MEILKISNCFWFLYKLSRIILYIDITVKYHLKAKSKFSVLIHILNQHKCTETSRSELLYPNITISVDLNHSIAPDPAQDDKEHQLPILTHEK